MEKLVYRGKTKDVFRRRDGNLKLLFKDDATGYIIDKGKPTEKIVFNSGYDEIVGKIPGKGVISCQFTKFFLELLRERGIPTHYISSPRPNVMIVEPAKLLGVPNLAKEFKGSADIYNLEWVFRREVYGSYWRRYPCSIPGNKLNLVEIYTKGRAGEPDVLVVDDALVELGVMTPEEVRITKRRTMEIGEIMSEEFAKRGFHLVDGKIEWGRSLKTGEIILIDDLSPDTFRVCQGYTPDKDGNCKVNKECITTNFENGKRTIEAKNILTADPQGLKKLAEAFELRI